MILLVLLIQVAPADVVVTARKRHCDISVANRILSDKEFDRRATEWAAGVPVRVHAPDGASRKCLARIFFKLADRGVTRVEFVDGDPTAPLFNAIASNELGTSLSREYGSYHCIELTKIIAKDRARHRGGHSDVSMSEGPRSPTA